MELCHQTQRDEETIVGTFIYLRRLRHSPSRGVPPHTQSPRSCSIDSSLRKRCDLGQCNLRSRVFDSLRRPRSINYLAHHGHHGSTLCPEQARSSTCLGLTQPSSLLRSLPQLKRWRRILKRRYGFSAMPSRGNSVQTGRSPLAIRTGGGFGEASPAAFSLHFRRRGIHGRPVARFLSGLRHSRSADPSTSRRSPRPSGNLAYTPTSFWPDDWTS